MQHDEMTTTTNNSQSRAPPQPQAVPEHNSAADSQQEFHLTIVRHGQTLANLEKVIQGHSNTPLTELGREQASALAAYFYTHGPRHFQRVYSSDLGRAHHTCQLLLARLHQLLSSPSPSSSTSTSLDGRRKAPSDEWPKQHQSSSITLSQQLRERRYGSYFEGKPIGLLQAEAFKLGYDSTSFTRYTPPEAESMEQVGARVASFCRDTLWLEPAHGDEVLIVSHWATIKEFLKLFQPLVQGPARITGEHLLETPNLAFSRFKIRRLAGHQQPFYTHNAGPQIQVQVISLHQTVHLRADQISVNLRQLLC